MRLFATDSAASFSQIFRLRGVCTWICVVFAVICQSRVVQAETCGHYLFKNGQPVAGLHSATFAQPTATATRPEQRLPVAPTVPCSGPNCRKQTTPLLPAPAAPTTSAASDPVAILHLLLSAQCCVDGLIAPQSERGEFWMAAEVFRPPAVR